MAVHNLASRAAASVREPLLAHRMCERLSLDVARTFRLQYLLSGNADDAPTGFLSHPVGNWFLHHCPSAPLTLLTDARDRPVGLCLGLAVDASGTLLRNRYKFSADSKNKTFFDQAEKDITWFAGRYVVIVSDGKKTVAYGDPAGAYPLVYNAAEGLVAASPLLALRRDIQPTPGFDIAAITGLDDPNQVDIDAPRGKTKGGFSFGATADRDVKRLTPNFRLSLDDFTETRFWPPADQDFTAGSDDLAALASAFCDRLGKVCNSLARHAPAQFALSGGYDSRMLLAAAAADGLHHNIALHSHAMTWASMLDTVSATILAKHLGLPIHIEQPENGFRSDFRGPEDQKQAQLLHDLSGGFVSPLNGQIKRGVLEWIPQDNLLLRGNMLELVGAVWWPNARKLHSVDHIQHAVVLSQVSFTDDAQHDDRRDRMQAWVDALPETAKPFMHDFNYIENTLPYTQSGLLSVNHCFYVPPACDRRIFALCLAAPLLKRRRRRFYRHIMRQSRPDLIRLPMSHDVAEKQRQERANA